MVLDGPAFSASPKLSDMKIESNMKFGGFVKLWYNTTNYW